MRNIQAAAVHGVNAWGRSLPDRTGVDGVRGLDTRRCSPVTRLDYSANERRGKGNPSLLCDQDSLTRGFTGRGAGRDDTTMKAEDSEAEPRWSGAGDPKDYKSDERTAGGCKEKQVNRDLHGNATGRPPELSDRRPLRHRAPVDYCLTRRNRGRGKHPGGEAEERRSRGVARSAGRMPGSKVACPMCKREFSRQYNCQRHERAVHGEGGSQGGLMSGGPLKTEPMRGGSPKGKSRIRGSRARHCPECGKGYTYLACLLNHERTCRAESDSNKKRGTGGPEPQGLGEAACQRRRETQRGGTAMGSALREHSRQVKEEERGRRGGASVKQEVTPRKVKAAPWGGSVPPTGMETHVKEERVEVALEHPGVGRKTELGKTVEKQEATEMSRWDSREEKHKGMTEPQLAGPSRDACLLDCLDCGAPFLLESELHQHYMDHARVGGGHRTPIRYSRGGRV